jgi:hypothetical protein
MASAASIVNRRALASLKIERRVAGLAREFKISVPPINRRSYPDPEHRQADLDERTVEILTRLLRAKNPKSPELDDLPQGQINEEVTTYSKDEKGNTYAEHSTKPLRR